MKQLRILLEYHCVPIWLEDEDGSLTCPEIPKELENDREFVELVENIMKEYDNLFENTKIVFEYHGFKTEEEKVGFFNKVSKMVSQLKEKVGHIYEIQVDVEPSKY